MKTVNQRIATRRGRNGNLKAETAEQKRRDRLGIPDNAPEKSNLRSDQGSGSIK